MFKKKTLTIVTTVLICSNLMGTGMALASNHQIKPGDTLSTIASNYQVTVEALKKANNMTNDTIFPGAYLYVPDGKAQHVVVKGDTLTTLAKRYKVTVEDLKRANKLTSDTLKPGQTLTIPLNTATPVSSRNSSTSSKAFQATPDEVDLLAKAIYGEARGESLSGQIAVGAVILNRVKSPDFPNTIKEVIFQPSAFTAVQDGQFYLKPDFKAYEAAREALKGMDPTHGSTYYWNPKTATSQWIWSRAVITQIGNHIFGY